MPLIKDLRDMALEADNRLLGTLTASEQGFNIAKLDDIGHPG